MNNEFISYEQALALKELGFEESCLGYYTTGNDVTLDKDGNKTNFVLLSAKLRGELVGHGYVRNSLFKWLKENDKTSGELYTLSNSVTAPLYQQAFRWLYQKLSIENGTMLLDTETQQLLLKELIDKVSSKQETVEEDAKRAPYFELVDKKAESNNTIDLDAYAKGVEDGVIWQAKKMYSEEDLISFAHFYFKEEFNSTMQTSKSTDEILQDWFEQFSKLKNG
jgi:hypothetical protein